MYNIGQKSTSIQAVMPPFDSRSDRVGRYLKKYMGMFVFDEFSPSYLNRAAGKLDFMAGVPIPLQKGDMEAFQKEEGLNVVRIIENMAWVMGMDPKFKYSPEYIEYIGVYFNKRALEGFVKKGKDAAESGDMDEATIMFRAALMLRPDDIHAMVSYARACRKQYLSGGNEEYVGRYKAESIEYFELLTQIYPRYSEAYYYLGYAYLNMGLYQKAALTWEEFLKKSLNAKDKKEIRGRMEQLKQPIEIEKGCNAVMTGYFLEGLTLLEPFLDTNFKGWWPLSYYLGVCYSRIGKRKLAYKSFHKALSLNPSHGESMLELAELYAEDNDRRNEMKYKNKARLILDEEGE